VDSASNRNECQEYFLRGKGCQCIGLTTLPPSCAECLEIWEPQPSGTLRACPEIALLYLTVSDSGHNFTLRMTGLFIKLMYENYMTQLLPTSSLLIDIDRYTGLLKMIVGVLTTCHTQYT